MNEVYTIATLEVKDKRDATTEENKAIKEVKAILDKAGLELIGTRPKRV